MHRNRLVDRSARAALASCLVLAGCGQGASSSAPGDLSDTQPFSGIAAGETLHLTGTEPFWGAEVSEGSLTYTTPENPGGTAITVERFAGRGGVSFSGELDGQRVDLMVTPGACSDGMSDRDYPFNATLNLGEETRTGCAWSDSQPFTGPEQP